MQQHRLVSEYRELEGSAQAVRMPWMETTWRREEEPEEEGTGNGAQSDARNYSDAEKR